MKIFKTILTWGENTSKAGQIETLAEGVTLHKAEKALINRLNRHDQISVSIDEDAVIDADMLPDRHTIWTRGERSVRYGDYSIAIEADFYKTVEQVKADPDYASALELPAIQLYLIYRGGPNVEYYAFRDGKVLFHGDDYKPAPAHSVDGIESMIDLLGFLTSQPGDTDREYFKNYTAEQMEWSTSTECEHLSLLLSDYEQGHKEYFESRFTYGI